MSDDPHSPTVALSNRQDRPVDETALVDLARRTLLAEEASHVELSLSLVSEQEMADLHETYLGEPGSTDVLAFPLEDDGDDGPRLLGDVVICPDVAARQATDLEAELRLLVVHGLLHLLGYDHDEAEDRRLMWERQERYSGVSVDDEGAREVAG